MSNFHPPEAVSRGSESQLQVDENLNNLACLVEDISDHTCPCMFMRTTVFDLLQTANCSRLRGRG